MSWGAALGAAAVLASLPLVAHLPKRRRSEVVLVAVAVSTLIASPLLQLVVAVAGIGALVLSRRTRRSIGRGPSWFLILYGVLAVASTLWSVSPATTLGKAAALIGLVGLTSLVSSGSERSPKVLLLVLPSFAAIWALSAAVISPSQAFIEVGGSGVRRLTLAGLGTHPNTLGLVLAIGFLAAIAWRTGPDRIRSSASYIAVGATGAGVLLTQSRTALLAVTLGLCYFAFTRVLNRRLVIVGIMALPAIFMVVGPMLGDALSRGQSSTALSQLSGRLPIWTVAWEIIGDNPIAGQGYYAASASLVQERAEGNVFFAYDISTSDNMFLDAGLGLGLVGVLLVGLASARFVRLALGLVTQPPGRTTADATTRPRLMACGAVAAALMVRALTAPGFDVFGVAAVFFVVSSNTLAARPRRPAPVEMVPS